MINTLEIDSVRKQYDYKNILSDVYLKISRGEIIGLLGRNGSGKSTLLKIIFGIVPADFKFILINGKIVSKTSESLKHISYLDQNSFIPNYFSVQKAVSLSIPKDSIAHFYVDALIQQIKNSKISQLSGGELKYLELKLVLQNESKFVLLDEPYSGLAPIMYGKVNLLIQQNASKKGIIVTDHNYEEILKTATRIVLLKNGKTISIQNKDELVEFGYLNGL